MTDKPHNNLFEFAFSQKPIFKDLITNFLPDLSKDIDSRTLKLDDTTYIEESLTDFYSDLVYNVRLKGGQSAKIALLLEHKSNVPQFPHLQLMDYTRGIWRKDTQNHSSKKSKGRKKLTTVIPIIFYHGKKKWHKRAFKDYFDDVPPSAASFIPTIPYHLIDLADYSDEFILKLKAGFLINSLIAFKHHSDTVYVKQHFARFFVNLEKYEEDERIRNFVKVLGVYVVHTTPLKMKEIIELTEKLPNQAKNIVMTGYETLLMEGEKKGLQKGLQKGYREKELDLILSVKNLIFYGITDDIILKSNKIDADVLTLLRKNIETDFKNVEMQSKLVLELIERYIYLKMEDIADITKLDKNIILSLSEENKKK